MEPQNPYIEEVIASIMNKARSCNPNYMEADIKRTVVQSQPWQNICEIPSQEMSWVL
jgi:hypothetical protein